MRLFKAFNRLQTAMLLPFLICSVFVAVAEIMQLICIYTGLAADAKNVLSGFSESLYALTGYVFCYYITLKLTNGKQAFKAFWSVMCFALLSTAANSFVDGIPLFILGIFTGLLCSFCFNRFGMILALAVTVGTCVIIGILTGLVSDSWNNFIMELSGFISDKAYFSPVLFGVVDNIFSLLDIDTFREMIFNNSYGGSVLIGDEIVTGVKDMLKAGYSGKLVSTYLSGHYFLLFSLSGISAALFFDLKGVQRYVLLATAVCAVISGNLTFLLLFLFLESPYLFAAVLILSAGAYLAAYVIDLGMGYLADGGITEMIIYSDKLVYLLAGGVVFVAIGYFVYKFVFEMHGISDCCNVYIPTRLNGFVTALGGMSNIIRYKDGGIFVRNPKLVDTVSVECEIDENFIKTEDERLDELREYL